MDARASRSRHHLRRRCDLVRAGDHLRHRREHREAPPARDRSQG
ncbi:MAG: hypothetical protein WC483_05475 [Candidatus Paceibacterota bacterium]